ncbi:MAG: hypothetical protein BJ554DRAFT_3096 [Olpidium bornovanus]|uniref:Uncharacterized protein n=1 Tax=Olpidium bornovanus TaxID=278681 RepID=A0A8H7ZPJ4_9FUNG|nr:MAG: hypothetical protein BJ554DRAFT_3096 [Olpidium bornovanus]
MAEEITAGITWHFPEWITNADAIQRAASCQLEPQSNDGNRIRARLRTMANVFHHIETAEKKPNRSVVHQAPDLYSIIANRMLTSLYHLRSAFNEATKHVRFHPAIGYTWKTDVDEDDHGSLSSDEQPLSPSIGEKGDPCDPVVTDAVDSAEISQTETELLGFRTRVDHLILNASRIAETLRDREVEGERGPENPLSFTGETSTAPAPPGSRMALTLATVEEALSFVENPTSPQKGSASHALVVSCLQDCIKQMSITHCLGLYGQIQRGEKRESIRRKRRSRKVGDFCHLSPQFWGLPLAVAVGVDVFD